VSAAEALPKAWELSRQFNGALQHFCPDAIPQQRACLRLVRRDFDYTTGNLEILLSGAVGSAKSKLLAHLAVTHCLENPKARCGIGRRSMPDLRDTLWQEILDHIEEYFDDDGNRHGLRRGVDYWVNETRGTIRFANKSMIRCLSWADRKYKKFRSKPYSMVIIDEGTENDEQDKEAFIELGKRLRRVPGVKENVMIVATNPDSPKHWLYSYFIEPNSGGKQHETRRVFYSRTEDNIFLDPIYIRGLYKSMDARRARRDLGGEWLDISADGVYYAYASAFNFRNRPYEIDKRHPVYISWDFNIGKNKPLSVIVGQFIDDEYHWFNQVIVEGMRTGQSCDELAEKGILDLDVPHFIVCGDASGMHKDTRNNQSDWDIVKKFFANYKTKAGKAIQFKFWVPVSNPPIRNRHNLVNAYCCNSLGERRLFVYKDAFTIDQGLRLTELKKGAVLCENDSFAYQHCTTALGYALHANTIWFNRKAGGTTEM